LLRSKSEIDERYVDSPYYLVPENKVALEAFAVIRDAMRGKGMVGLGRVVLSKRERVVMLQPRGSGLLGTTLRYPYEISSARLSTMRSPANQRGMISSLTGPIVSRL
jgi:DNA end-binding protein Ku